MFHISFECCNELKRTQNYNTKQREAILAYIISHKNENLSASIIAKHFKEKEFHIGRTTVYRQLEKLADNGLIYKYPSEGSHSACFQYSEKSKTCQKHFHLKCDNCGELLHMQCETMDEIQKLILNRHSFKINDLSTVLYGKCESCLNKT